MPNIQKIHPKIGPSTTTQSLKQSLEGDKIEGIECVLFRAILLKFYGIFKKRSSRAESRP